MTDLGMPTLIELPGPEDCAGLCRELGLQFIELNMNLPQYQTDRIDIERLERIKEEYGIYFTIHLDENLNPSDFNRYVAQAYRQTAADAIQLAKRLEVPVLNMHLSPGIHFKLPGKKVDLFSAYQGEYQESMRRFRDACEAAIGGSDMKICVENTDGYRDFQLRALDILLGSPDFALTFDIGHNHGAGGGDEAWILRHRERLIHFHLHDAKGAWCHLPFGEGELDVLRYLHLAESQNGRAVLEVKTAAGLRQSVEWLKAKRSFA